MKALLALVLAASLPVPAPGAVGGKAEFVLVFRQAPRDMVGAVQVAIAPEAADRCGMLREAAALREQNFSRPVEIFTCRPGAGKLWKGRSCRRQLKAEEKQVAGVLVRGRNRAGICRVGELRADSRWLSGHTALPSSECTELLRRLRCP